MKAKILEAIKQFDTIIIHRHIRPDPDAYGSQCGLAEIVKNIFSREEGIRNGRRSGVIKIFIPDG
jgi:bifunctional oligoribonuclease and PAP phosphatase NrnA